MGSLTNRFDGKNDGHIDINSMIDLCLIPTCFTKSQELWVDNYETIVFYGFPEKIFLLVSGIP